MLTLTAEQNNTMMPKTELSWVYIFVNALSRELHIGFTFNLYTRFSHPDDLEKLIYYRSFSDPFDALAHKHLLDSLTKESVMHKLKQMNPNLKSLIPEISDG
ncbi:MAG: hypothetical protein M0Q90_15230 [Bacteroidales bacterium]|nr:hypothetical protein [Bacteroidales bacterium]